MLAAGRLNRRVTLQTRTTTRDAHGGETETFTAGQTIAAEVRYGNGQERRDAAQQAGSQTATFMVRAWSLTLELTVRDRVGFDGADWDIQDRSLIGREAIEFTATRAA